MNDKSAREGLRVCLSGYAGQQGRIAEVRAHTVIVDWDNGTREELCTGAIRPVTTKRAPFASPYPGHGTNADPDGIPWHLGEHPDMRGAWGRFTQAQYHGGNPDE